MEEDRSGEEGRGLRGEELRSEEKDTPCLRISCTALSLWRRTGGADQYVIVSPLI